MKKMRTMLLLLFAVTLLLCGCGGGGGGSSDVPKGENPGIPTVVQVLPTQFVAQTNSTLFVNAKVLDGNGLPIVNTPVVFTNLSLTGGTPSTVRAITDAEGIARTTLTSSTPGFATIQAEISSGSGIVRDIKTVFFSSFSRSFPGPTMRIDIDGDGDGVFNEPNDFIIFENPSDRQILVRATVLDPFGQPVAGELVRFGADSTEAVFPISLGDSAATDANGQANILMEFSPQAIRPFAMTINIFGLGDFSGAANLVSVFVQPITVRSVVVSANPNPVESGKEATISAVVTTSAGTFVPDGTAVNFSSTDGGIEPFAQTVNGVASVQYTAPSLEAGFDLSGTITASVAGVRGSLSLTIKAPVVPPPPVTPLTVQPTTMTICENDASCPAGATSRSFVISGGTAPYTVSSSDLAVVSATLTGTALTATAVAGSVAGTAAVVDLTIVDSSAPTQSIIVTVTVTGQP